MKKSSPIVVAVDFSSSSEQVLAHGVRLAAGLNTRLFAVHVVSESPLKDWAQSMNREASADERVELMSGLLNGMVTESCGDLVTGATVRVGRPYQKLKEVVTELGAGLIVLGAHDVANRRLGSVAGRCARLMPADVLILRDWQTRFFKRIVVGVDFTQSSTAVLDRAITLAEIHQAALEIIHVIFPPQSDPWGKVLQRRSEVDEGYEAAVRKRATGRLKALLEPFSDRLSRLESNILFLEGESPSAAIIAHVGAEDVDLTVMGSHSDSWIEDLVLGSNTERLMHDSTSSVLIVRGRTG